MGTFVENSLISGEKIEKQAIVTWWSQFWYILFSLMFIATVFFFIFSLLCVLVAIINVITTELAVTNKKVIGKTGFIRRLSIDLPLNKLESINIHQSILGRIFGFGKVSIRGIGGNAVTIPFIKNPMEFRRIVMGLIDNSPSLKQA